MVKFIYNVFVNFISVVLVPSIALLGEESPMRQLPEVSPLSVRNAQEQARKLKSTFLREGLS